MGALVGALVGALATPGVQGPVLARTDLVVLGLGPEATRNHLETTGNHLEDIGWTREEISNGAVGVGRVAGSHKLRQTWTSSNHLWPPAAALGAKGGDAADNLGAVGLALEHAASLVPLALRVVGQPPGAG